jgi:methylmalonyl-CoA epimerase
MNVRPPGALPVDHVAIAVHSLDEARPLYELLAGESCSLPETLASHGVRVAFCGDVELLEPHNGSGPLARFLAARGPGLHHVAYRSSDLRADLARLEAAGIDLIDAEPRRGARGHLVAFLHPRSTGGVLVELVQTMSP